MPTLKETAHQQTLGQEASTSLFEELIRPQTEVPTLPTRQESSLLHEIESPAPEQYSRAAARQRARHSHHREIQERELAVDGVHAVRTGQELVRLAGNDRPDTAQAFREDLFEWAQREGISLERSVAGDIGPEAIKQFQEWFRNKHPNVEWASRADGIIGPRTTRQLDYVLDRKEELQREDKWLNNREFEQILQSTQTRYYYRSEEGRQELQELLEDPQNKDMLQSSSLEPEDLYHALASAETGGLQDPMIRTKASHASSAYGEVQITYTLAKEVMKRGDIPPHLRSYAKDFIAQGRKFLRASQGRLHHDGRYGLGGKGDLGNSPTDYEKYKEFAKAVITSELKRCTGATKQEKLLEFIEMWRGKEQHEDPRYYRTVRGAYSSLDTSNESQESTTKKA